MSTVNKNDPRYEERLAVYKRMHVDFEYYAYNNLKISPKAGDLFPFELNRAQKYLHTIAERQLKETGRVRIIVLKGRQQGCSTYIEGRFYWKVSQRKGVKAFILTHESEATSNLFKMAKRYHDNCMPQFRPQLRASNATELDFDLLDSGYRVGTAGNKSVGRSSTIQYLHASEAGLYKNASEITTGLMQAVPDCDETEVFIESTAKGVGNWFHQQWLMAEAGLSDYEAVFIPWYWQDEYKKTVPDDFTCTNEELTLKDLYHLTDEQIYWRRMKIIFLSAEGVDGEKQFMQEYPFTPVEAFQSSSDDVYLDATQVMKARKNNGKHIEAIGLRLCGLDPARFGDDRTAFAWRQGRVVSKIKTYKKLNLMQVAGIAHVLLESGEIDKLFIDIGGLGAGVYDRLVENGWKDKLVAVNSANKALNESKYVNKRAEMWAKGHEWLEEEPVVLPDSDELQGDLCNTRYSFDSKGRLLMESKADMKKRGIRSSDCADAVLLTFALPFSALSAGKTDSKKTAKTIMSAMTAASNAKKGRYR